MLKAYEHKRRNQYDPHQSDVSGREMETLEKLLLLDAAMQRGAGAIKARLGQIENGWRDYRMLSTVLDKLVEKLLDTCPLKTLKRLKHMALNSEIVIRPTFCGRMDGFATVPMDSLETVLHALCAAECAICIRDDSEVKRCRLRKAMMTFAPVDNIPQFGCGYRDFALNQARA